MTSPNASRGSARCRRRTAIGVLISWAMPAASWPTASSFCASRRSSSSAVAVGLGALGGGDVEEQPLQQAPVAVRRDHRTGVADPHLLAAGLDAAILGGLGLAAVGRALDDRRDSGAVVGMHARQQAIEAAHPLRHGEADELLDLRGDVQRARRLAVLAQFDDVDRTRDLLDQLAVARLRELEHAPALVQRIAEGGGQCARLAHHQQEAHHRQGRQGGTGDGNGNDRREAVGDVREGRHHAVQAEHQRADERRRTEEHRPRDIRARVPARLAHAEAAHRRMQGGQADEHGLQGPADVAPGSGCVGARDRQPVPCHVGEHDANAAPASSQAANGRGRGASARRAAAEKRMTSHTT